MDDLIRRFRDYQIEWLTAHNDIEFCEEEENLIIGFLKDTAECFVREETEQPEDWVARALYMDDIGYPTPEEARRAWEGLKHDSTLHSE